MGHLWTQVVNKTPQRPHFPKNFEPFGEPFWHNFRYFGRLIFESFLRYLLEAQNSQNYTKRIPKLTPTLFQNTLLGDLPEVSWIWYLLYGSHMGLSRDAPGRHPKSSPIPEPLPNTIVLDFERIWASFWEPFWHNFRSFFRVRFLIGF